MIQFDGEKVLKAYRYRTDRLLKDDVKDTMPCGHFGLWNTSEMFIQQYMQRMNSNNLVYREVQVKLAKNIIIFYNYCLWLLFYFEKKKNGGNSPFLMDERF